MFLFALLLFANICACLRSSSKHLIPPSAVSPEVAHTVIEEVASGPLADRDLFVLLDDNVGQADQIDSLIKSFRKPLTLLSINENTLNEDYEVIKKSSVVFLLNVSILSPIFSDPPPLLDATSVIAFNLDLRLEPKHFFATSLFARSKAAAIFHPFLYTKEEIVNAKFKIYQDIGFDSRGKRSYRVNFWDAESFQTFESLFMEKWNALGEVLQIANDYDDKPLIFQTDNDELAGISIKLLNVIAKQMNFSYVTQIRACDGEWGAFENGSWNGMLGQIYRREKNLTVNYFTVTYERVQDFDYSASFYTEGFGFVLKIPPPLPRWMSLIYPFTKAFWIGTAVSVISITVLFYFYVRLYDYQDRNLLTISFILLMKPLLKQPAPEMKIETKFHSILFIIWWLVSFVISTSYTCNFIAVLTVATFPPRVLLTKQLAESDYGIVMMDYGEFVPEALKNSKDSILKKLGKKLDLIPQIVSVEYSNYGKARDLVMNGTYAQIETLSYLKLLYASSFKLANQVYFMTEQIYYGNLAFFFPKRTPWKHKFDQVIPRLVESGIIKKWYNEIMEKEMGNVVEQTQSEITALTLDHFQGAFYILGICLILSAFAFLIEKAFHPKRQDGSLRQKSSE